MKFGAIFPTTELGSDPVAIRDWAQAAEALGYAHVIAYDHVLGAEHQVAHAGPSWAPIPSWIRSTSR